MKYPFILILFIAALMACTPVPPVTTPTMPIPALASEQTLQATTTAVKPLTGQATNSQPAAGDAPLIGYNQIKEGALDTPNQADAWVFNAQAGERVNIVLNSQFDGYLELFAPDGNIINSNDDSGTSLNAAMFDVQLSQNGPHTIIVRGYDGDQGAYVLALTGGHPTVGGGQLASGDSRTVVLSKRGLKWRYQGQQGSYLTLNVIAESGVDPLLSLYGPDGVLLAQNDDSGGSLNAELYEIELPIDGTYTVQASTIENSGLVTLTLSSSTQTAGGGLLPTGTSQQGLIKPGRSHNWTFAGEKGQIINLSVASTEFDAFLELRSSQGELLAENDDALGPDAALTDFVLPANDTYTVIARSISNSDGGNYQITLKQVKIPVGGGPLELGIPTQALLTPGENNPWTFELAAGTFITVKTEAESLDTYLELYDPDGVLITEDDDSGGGLNAALFDYALLDDGIYQLLIRPAQADSSEAGVYNIIVTASDEVAVSGELSPDEPVFRTLERGQQDTWTIEAEEDSYATIRLESETLDTHLSLYDQNGVLLSLNDDFLGKQAVIANFLVPKSGEYRVLARTYTPEDSGEYTLTLTISDEVLDIDQDPTQPDEEEQE